MAVQLSPSNQASNNYSRLLHWFSQHKGAFVAFSGGIDSTVVLQAAYEALGENAVAITARSPSLRSDELQETELLAKLIGVRHLLLDTQELKKEGYRANLGNRCYFCKSTLYETLYTELHELRLTQVGREKDFIVVDGTNLDDLQDYRPGGKAAEEAGVLHPLVELGIRKEMVREIGRFCTLPNWDKPAMACMASRIPAGTEVTKEKLEKVEAAELALKELGFSGFRVRYHELFPPTSREIDTSAPALARVELLAEDIARASAEPLRGKIVSALRSAGFALVTIDLQGYKLGGMEQDEA